MDAPHIIKTPSGDEMVILPKAEYDALVHAAEEAIEDAADVAAYDAAVARLSSGEDSILPAEVSASLLAGDRLPRALRKWRGVSQVELASAAGITQGHLSDIETGRRKITTALAGKLSAALNVPARWLDG